MSTELETNLRYILSEKTSKIIPENIKDGVTILGVEGELKEGNPTNPEIELGQEIGTEAATTRTWTVDSYINSYCYAIVYHRTAINSFTSGWTKWKEYNQGSAGDGYDYITIFYKKATATSETFSVTTSDSQRLGGVLIPTINNFTLANEVYNTNPSAQTTTTSVSPYDIIICSCRTTYIGVTTTWSVDFSNISYPCRETTNSNTSRFNIFIPTVTTLNGTITAANDFYETQRIIILRLPKNNDGENLIPENIKSGVTIFGVTGTY